MTSELLMGIFNSVLTYFKGNKNVIVRFMKLSILLFLFLDVAYYPDRFRVWIHYRQLRQTSCRVIPEMKIVLDGYASKGTELKAFWDFDDRDGVEKQAEGMIVNSHIYKKAGAYIATFNG